MKIDAILESGFAIVDAAKGDGQVPNIMYFQRDDGLYFSQQLTTNLGTQAGWSYPERVHKVCVYTDHGEDDLMNDHGDDICRFSQKDAARVARMMKVRGVFAWVAPL